jgi:hypothetical protein
MDKLMNKLMDKMNKVFGELLDGWIVDGWIN